MTDDGVTGAPGTLPLLPSKIVDEDGNTVFVRTDIHGDAKSGDDDD